MVAWATSIRLSTSSASTRAVLNTRDLSCSVTALACARSAAILRTPSSIPRGAQSAGRGLRVDPAAGLVELVQPLERALGGIRGQGFVLPLALVELDDVA